MSRARTFSKMINKANYRTHRGHSSISEIEVATETTASDTVSVIGSTAVPALVGMIAPFSMETTTEWRSTNRWIICDGSPVSRTAYNHLFDVIGTTWGVGDGSSTFNLPDLRGEFLRGFDGGQGNDPDAASRTGGDAVGSSQGNNIAFTITKSKSPYNSDHNNYNLYFTSTGATWGAWPEITTGVSSYSYGRGPTSTGYVTQLAVGSGTDTRPRNKYVQYCIKY